MYKFSETQKKALNQKVQNTSFRKFSSEYHLSTSQVLGMLNGADTDYRISTLENVAKAFNIPLWFFLMVADLDEGKLDTSKGKKLENIFLLYMDRLIKPSV